MKQITLNDIQLARIDDILGDYCYDCGLGEDDNVRYDEIEVDVDDDTLVMLEIAVLCDYEDYTSATYDQPAEGCTGYHVEIKRAYTYDEDGNKVEVNIGKDMYEYEFAY